MMKSQRNLMEFTRRSLCAAANLRLFPRTMLKTLALTVAITMTFQIAPSANAEPSPSAKASASANPSTNVQPSPRKILTGWIPYYGMNVSLPTAVVNADLINEVMPFWYTLKLNSKTKAPYILDLYTPGNPSVAIGGSG